jgi:hypothetical protein
VLKKEKEKGRIFPFLMVYAVFGSVYSTVGEPPTAVRALVFLLLLANQFWSPNHLTLPTQVSTQAGLSPEG